MKINVLCNTDSLAIPSVHALNERGLLGAVGIPEKSKSRLYPQLIRLGLQNIIALDATQWQEQMEEWLEETHPDVVWVFTFPWKIPAALLSIPQHGFMNFHFGTLPAYRGADPVFWQMKNREATCGLTIHQMTPEIDMGPIVWKEDVPAIPGETYGMNCARLGLVTSNLIDKVTEAMNDPNFSFTPQSQEKSRFSKRPEVSDFSIRWQTQSAEDIEWLVNATNPKYGGAVTTLRGMEVRILEITPAEIANAPETIPGTIVHADNIYGLIVACADKKFIRINIMHLAEGYLSGIKLFNLGIRVGERFA